MSTRLCLCLGALLAGALPSNSFAGEPAPGAAVSNDLIRSALAADVQRTAAMLSSDTRMLGRMLADELTFGHPDGRLDNKEALLTALFNGRLRYHAINPGAREVRVIGEDVAIVSGRADLLVGPADAPAPLTIRYLAVYRLDPHTGWKLSAYQSTAIATPAE